MEWVAIQAELLSEARNWPTQHTFTKDSSMDLASVIGGAVARMVEQNRTSDADMETAREGVRRLLEQMDDERSAMGLDVFTESTLANALGRLCPGFFPFC